MAASPKSLRDRADETARRIQGIFGSPPDAYPKEIADAVEQAIIDALLEERERCAGVAFDHVCQEDRDKAHKVAEEVRRIRSALVTNLSSMR